jgi:hypothetical protein
LLLCNSLIFEKFLWYSNLIFLVPEMRWAG